MPRSERLGTLAKDRQIVAIDKDTITPSAGNLLGNAQLHQGFQRLGRGREAQAPKQNSAGQCCLGACGTRLQTPALHLANLNNQATY